MYIKNGIFCGQFIEQMNSVVVSKEKMYKNRNVSLK